MSESKLKIFNTLTREKEEFIPLDGNNVRFYSCGPTVYWHPHIGNMRSYIFNDLLKRVLTYNGFKVTHVMNYTDVGHLTSDGDTGDDKIEQAAKKENKKASEIAEFYIKTFDEDALKLNIIPPSITCKATDYIKEQIDIIKDLEDKGIAYKTADGIYYDTTKYDDYAKLGRLNIEGLDSGHRIDAGEKRNKTDFALWKFSVEPGIRQQEWDSPWGIGFPGWHTECVVMATKHLGNQFDLHTGGEDHIQVHHTNEIAQAEMSYGKRPWVKYWMHGAYLNFKGEKISKSKGGLYTIPDLMEQGYDPLTFRYFCISANYRKQTNFSMEALSGSGKALESLKLAVQEIKSKDDSNKTESFDKYKQNFLDAINDDLNTPQALSVLHAVVKNTKLGNKEKLELILDFDKVFGLKLDETNIQEKITTSKEVEDLLIARTKAREDKDWNEADKIRDKLKKLGYEVNDTANGPILKKI